MPNPVVTFYEPGQAPAEWTAGDFLLTRNQAPWHTKDGFVDGMIRTGERWMLRRAGVSKKDRAQLARWSHAVAVSASLTPAGGLGTDLHLVEAVGRGVIVSPLDRYHPDEFLYVHTDLIDSQRYDACATWEGLVGTRYGYLTDVAIGISSASGSRLRIKREHTVICSGLVAAGLGTYQWRDDPSYVRPDSLAAYHGITGRVPGT